MVDLLGVDVAQLERLLEDDDDMHSWCSTCKPLVDGQPQMVCGVVLEWGEMTLGDDDSPECVPCTAAEWCPRCGVQFYR